MDAARDFESATVVVTGAAGAVGSSAAAAFADAGAHAVVSDRDADALDAVGDEVAAVAGDGAVTAHRADVRDEFDVERLMEAASRAGPATGVDAVVPCAAVAHGGPGGAPLPGASYSGFDDAMRTNARGVFAAVREAAPHFADDARVVVPTDPAARDPSPGDGAYAVSKAAAEAVARGFAADLDAAVGCLDLGPTAGSDGDAASDDADAGALLVWAASRPADALDGAVLAPDDRGTDSPD